MVCPLCGTRRAKRACPALGQQICPVCCGTKRLVEIPCPNDCPYLASAREHPAAVLVRQQQRDAGFMMQFVRDFSERQTQLFLLIATFLMRAKPLEPLVDDDIADAMRALASTYETSVRGIIYDHRPASLPAEGLVAGLKPLLAEASKGGGTAFERDAAVVMRRIEQAIVDARGADLQNRRAFVDILGRVLAGEAGTDPAPSVQTPDAPRLIVP